MAEEENDRQIDRAYREKEDSVKTSVGKEDKQTDRIQGRGRKEEKLEGGVAVKETEEIDSVRRKGRQNEGECWQRRQTNRSYTEKKKDL